MGEPRAWPRTAPLERAAAAFLILLAAADLATAVPGDGTPYVHAGQPGTVLGAAARALTAALAAYALWTGRAPGLRRFGAVLVFVLLSLWAPRPVWLQAGRDPVFDPFAPMIANLLHVIGLALLAGAFLRAGARGLESPGGFWRRQLRGGALVRLAAVLPVVAYPYQVKVMLGEWGAGGRTFLWAVGSLWLMALAGCMVGGLAFLRRTARGADPGERDLARQALRATVAALALYLVVRALAGDLAVWAADLAGDLGRPFGPFSLFAVRISAADTAGTVGFSCAGLAFAIALAGRRRAPGLTA